MKTALKFSAVILVFVLLCSVTCVTAFADSTGVSVKALSKLDELERVVNITEFKSFLLEKASSYSDRIDISSFKIPNTESLTGAIVYLMSNEIPELFNIDGLTFCGGELLIQILPSYSMSASEYRKKFSAAKAEADRLLDGIEGNDSLTDVEKALLLHDRLVVHCEYDLTLNGHDMYSALVERSTICQGYTEAYAYLLSRVGIKSRYCSSEKLEHAWNIVYIDGKTYHVDVTWDDKVQDVTGRVFHENFMRSSRGMYDSGHIDLDFDMSPDDTAYDNYFWQDSIAEFQLLNGNIYYIDNSKSKLMKKTGATGTELCDLSDRWLASETTYWVGNFSVLTNDGKNLIYSKSDAVYSFDTESGTSSKIYSPDLSVGKFFSVYGMTLKDGILICEIFNYPVFNPDTKSKYQIKIPYNTISSGDLPDNADIVLIDGTEYIVGIKEKTEIKTISGTDIKVFDKYGKEKTSGYLATEDHIVVCDRSGNKQSDSTVIIKGDVNGDGKVTVADYVNVRLVLLKKLSLSTAQSIASRVSGGSVLTAKDYVNIRLHLLGKLSLYK